jgi:hypothetical protein
VSDNELDRMLAAAAPVDDDVVAALDLDAAEDELREEIVVLRADERMEVEPPHRRRPGRLIAAATGVAAVSLVAAAILTSSGSPVVFAAAAVAVAEANPRVLVDRDDWKVVRADEFTVDDGEMTFSDGRQRLDLRWRPADEYDQVTAKRAEEDMAPEEITVLGRRSLMYRYPGTTDYFTYVPPEEGSEEGRHYMEVRGDLGGEEPYRALLADLIQVDVETWLGAMPPSVVKPADRAAAVDEMLQGIPTPPGFDADPLRSGEALKDRYQLGAQVTGAVACGWLDRWSDAKDAGDTATRDEAVAAMKTSHDWRILHEMNEEGDWPEVLWEIADAMDGGGVPTGKGLVPLDDRELYVSALGCER